MMMKEKIYRESMNFKLLSTAQLKNVFPEWENMINRIENYHQWLENVDLDKNDLMNKQYNLMYENVYSILGGRGAGKTSVIFTLRKYIEEYYPSDIVLPIVMPEVIPEGSDTLGWILASLESLVKELSSSMREKHQRSNDIFYDCKNRDNSLRTIYDEVKELCYSRQMKVGGNSFSEEIRNNERKNQSGYELSRKISEFWIRLIDTIKEVNRGKEYKQKEPLIYLIFDDVDLSPERALEICSTITKYLSHPNLIIIMTADEELFYDVILDSITYKMRNLEEYFKMCEFSIKQKECDSYCNKLSDTASLYMGKIMPVSSRYMLKTFEECSEKQGFLLDGREEKQQDLEHFLREMVNNLIRRDYRSSRRQMNNKNFLYYQGNFVSAYLMFFGNTSRQIADASLVIKNFFEELSSMNRLKDYPEKYKKEYLKERVRGFVVDILRTRGTYWGNNDDIIQISKNLIVTKRGTADIYIEYAYLQQLFYDEFKEVRESRNQYEDMIKDNIQENQSEERSIIKKNISLFMLMFFTENILLLMNPLLMEFGMYGQRNRVHGHRYLVKGLDAMLAMESNEESLIRCDTGSGNLSGFLYDYQNVLENYSMFIPFDRYNIADIRSYLYMLNKKESMEAKDLEKWYWESPKWFRTIVPMIWFAYKRTFLIDRRFYVENIKPLDKIPVYGRTVSKFLIKIEEVLRDIICGDEKKTIGIIGREGEYAKELAQIRDDIARLYMEVENYEVLDKEKVYDSIQFISQQSVDFEIKLMAEEIERKLEKKGDRVCLLSKNNMDSFFKSIERKDRRMQQSDYKKIWGEEETWGGILDKASIIKVNIDMSMADKNRKELIQMQFQYITIFKRLVAERLSSDEYFLELREIPNAGLFETIKKVYEGEESSNSIFSWDLKQIIREDTENYIKYIKNL